MPSKPNASDIAAVDKHGAPADAKPIPGRPGKRRQVCKTAQLEALLMRPKGATSAQLTRSLGWQPHSVRAAISRLRKRGVVVTLDKSGKTAAYRIEAAS